MTSLHWQARTQPTASQRESDKAATGVGSSEWASWTRIPADSLLQPVPFTIYFLFVVFGGCLARTLETMTIHWRCSNQQAAESCPPWSNFRNLFWSRRFPKKHIRIYSWVAFPPLNLMYRGFDCACICSGMLEGPCFRPCACWNGNPGWSPSGFPLNHP